MLDLEFYRERLTRFSFRPPDTLSGAKSLIVVASPQPQARAFFAYHGQPRPVMVPPTYSDETDIAVEHILSSVLNPERFHFIQASLPLKLLAARSGLGEYGRNNICYVPGMGSFHSLAAFYTDLPCPEDSWGEPQMMKRCHECRACIHGCPTGAIAVDRFLIRAERCITFHNERLGEFPAWIDPSWHNCLVGCLRCQRACPEDTPFLDWVEGSSTFSEEETTLILDSTSSDRLPIATTKKLEQLGILGYSDMLGRNLNALLGEAAAH